MIEEGLYTYLSAQSAVTDLVSTRIAEGELTPLETLPAVKFSLQSTTEDYTFDENQNDFVGARVEVHCWAKDRETARDVGEAVKDTLKNHTGTMGSITVRRVFLTDEVGTFYEDAVAAYRRTQLYLIWHFDPA